VQSLVGSLHAGFHKAVCRHQRTGSRAVTILSHPAGITSLLVRVNGDGRGGATGLHSDSFRTACSTWRQKPTDALLHCRTSGSRMSSSVILATRQKFSKRFVPVSAAPPSLFGDGNGLPGRHLQAVWPTWLPGGLPCDDVRRSGGHRRLGVAAYAAWLVIGPLG
jgi:hypothetical protein